MGTVYATTDDVQTLFRVLNDDELILADRLLRMASNMIRSKVATIDDRIADGTLDPDLVTDIVASMVVRVLRNPEGVTQETIGSVSASVSAAVAPGYLTVTDDELAMLTPATAKRSRVGTVRVNLPGHRYHPDLARRDRRNPLW